MRISDGSSDVCSSDRQLRADRRVRLESLHLVERGEVRVVVVEADDVADIGLVVLQVIDEGAAPGGAAHRPAGGVDDRARLVLRGVELPELLDADAVGLRVGALTQGKRSEEHTSELQSLMRISYAVFCLQKKKYTPQQTKIQDYDEMTH